MRRVVAYVWLFENILLSKGQFRAEEHKLDAKLIYDATVKIIKLEQATDFPDEIKGLSTNPFHVKGKNSVIKLKPFFDKDGVLRVGGRIRRSMLNLGLIHPVLLPKNGKVLELVIRWCHHMLADD